MLHNYSSMQYRYHCIDGLPSTGKALGLVTGDGSVRAFLLEASLATS